MDNFLQLIKIKKYACKIQRTKTSEKHIKHKFEEKILFCFIQIQLLIKKKLE